MDKSTKRNKEAQKLAEMGLRIFRLKPNSKLPLNTGWQNEAAPDPSPWAWDGNYNIGVLCGGGLLVIDIDMKNGVDGEASWKTLDIQESGLQVRTPSGGRHIYYSLPGGVRLSNSASKIGKGVDVRAEGGYVVGPGSMIDGVMYKAIAGEGREMMVAPEELIALCGKTKTRADNYDIPVGELDTDENIAQARAYLRRAPVSVQGAGGDNTAIIVALRLRDLGISEAMCLELMLGGR
jgi:hypothetical protein